MFGDTLEFSVTVEGKNVRQELVSSGKDCIVSFKMDAGHFVDSKTLREIASFIDNNRGLRLATELESKDYVSSAKAKVRLISEEQSNQTSTVFLMAEMLANQDGLTLYDHRATENIKEEVDNDNDYDDSEDENEDWDEEDDEEDEEDDEDWHEDDYPSGW